MPVQRHIQHFDFQLKARDARTSMAASDLSFGREQSSRYAAAACGIQLFHRSSRSALDTKLVLNLVPASVSSFRRVASCYQFYHLGYTVFVQQENSLQLNHFFSTYRDDGL